MALNDTQMKNTAATLIVAAALFMEMVDSTVITTALPAIGQSFHTAAANLSVSVSSYLVALTIFIPLSGWLAEKYGAKGVFCTAIVIFSFSSFLCSESSSVEAFTLCRILQGIGGAMMVPVGRYIVFKETPKEHIITAVALLTWPALFAPVLGPVTGGWITEHWGWPWIFIINIPLGGLVLILAWYILPNVSGKRTLCFDTKGFVLTATGFGCIMTGIELMGGNEFQYIIPVLCFTFGLFICWMSVKYLRKAQEPLLSFTPFSIQTFRTSSVSGSVFVIVLSTVPFLFPLEMQLTMGYSATESGALLLWLFLGNLSMKPLTTKIMNRFGFRNVLLVNGFLISLSFLGLSLLNRDTPHALIILLLFISGMCRSMQFTAFNTLRMSDIPKEQIKDASMLSSIMGQMNMGVGIAIASLILGLVCQINGVTFSSLTVMNFSESYLIIGLISLFAMVEIKALNCNAGQAVLKQKHS